MTTSTLKKKRSVPAYQRIEENLRTRIVSGQWAPGIMLPSRKDLAAEYSVSIPTIERAVSDLLSDGTLRADHRGTFVAAVALRVLARPTAPRYVKAATVGIIADGRPALGQSSRNQWTDILTSSLERTITATGGMTRFFELNSEDPDCFLNAVNTLLGEGVDALALVLIGRQNEEVSCVQSAGLPIIFLNGSKSQHSALSVYYNSYDASVQATTHLLEQGCSNLLFFAPYTINWVRERAAGAQEAILQAGLPLTALQFWVGDRELADVLGPIPIKDSQLSHITAALDSARILLAQNGGLTAQGVIATNDYAALGFRQAASEIGLTAGKDYALIGFDDHLEARLAGISTLQPPMDEMGREAGRLILSALAGQTKPMQVCLHSHLIARASSRLS